MELVGPSSREAPEGYSWKSLLMLAGQSGVKSGRIVWRLGNLWGLELVEALAIFVTPSGTGVSNLVVGPVEFG